MAGRYEAVLTAAEKLHVRLLRLLTGALTCTLWTMPVLGSLGIWDLMTHGPGLSGIFLILGFLAAYVCFLGILCWMCAACRRLRIVRRLLVWMLLWIPFLNYGLALYVRGLAKQETDHILYRISLDDVRAEKNVCSTKYPLLLVHGVGFRDFHYFNYWGRIPRALKKNGARVFYGHQEAWGTVEENAGILREKIFEILRETGEEKVNIIAHSKGGLDSRWAITKLGLAPQVASLTTINTPHRGCVFAQHLLSTMPKGVVGWIAHKYNSLFHTLGDTSPDFLGGVQDLTRETCLAFNAAVPDAPDVFYQSVTSTMRKASSAGFPLNFTWHLVKRYDKEANDGLVARTSAEWGHFLDCLTVPGKRGISHGDMIDLMREDVPGFDVREFYIGLVKGLKARGL